MDCPICGAIAEQFSTVPDRVGFDCPMCGDFEISRSVIAAGQLQKLTLEKRADVLAMARRSADGARPIITPYLLALVPAT